MKRFIVGSVVVIFALATGSCSKPETDVGTSSAAPQPASTTSSPPSAPKIAVERVIATGLHSPWGLAFLPDGSALVSERDTGLIKRVRPRTGQVAQVTVVGRVPGVVHSSGGEQGLLGLAIEPGNSVRRVFAYFTTSADNRIAVMTWNGAELGIPRPILTGIPAAAIHDGGRIVFGPDGYLYAGTGDAGVATRAQQVESLGGKILRVTASGRAAPGNPFGESPVWSLGHRNVQGLAFDSQQRLWASEFGSQLHDELNLITRGSNYGWPAHEGRARDSKFADPYVQWPTAEASPSGVAIIGGWAYLAALRGQRLWQVGIDKPVPVGPFELLVGEYGRLRTPIVAPDGSLWLTTSNTDGRANPRTGDDRIIQLNVA